MQHRPFWWGKIKILKVFFWRVLVTHEFRIVVEGGLNLPGAKGPVVPAGPGASGRALLPTPGRCGIPHRPGDGPVEGTHRPGSRGGTDPSG